MHKRYTCFNYIWEKKKNLNASITKNIRISSKTKG